MLKKFFKNIEIQAEVAISDFPPIKKARRRRIRHYVWTGIKIIVLAYLSLALILLLIEIKDVSAIIGRTYQGALALDSAVKSARDGDYKAAKDGSVYAQNKLSQSLLLLRKVNNSPLSYVPPFNSQIPEIEHLVAAFELITRSLSQGLSLVSDIKSMSSGDISATYATFSADEKKSILNRLYTSGPELNGLRADFQLALTELDRLKLHGVLWPAKYQILNLKEKLAQGSYYLDEAIPMTQLLPAFSGNPATSTFLVLLQNSDELRPTGGFIGTYGILQIRNGDIIRFDTHDVYHMDMPAQDKFKAVPPEPIKLYLNKDWYLRDSNWSPDWPTAANQILWFYNQENRLLTGKNDINRFNGTFNGVIAVNPRFVMELLKVVGPVTVKGQTYDSHNFTDILETEVEQNYADQDISKWQRKEVIGQIVKALKIKIFDHPSSEWLNIIDAADTSFKNKDLMLYFADPSLQQIADTKNWTGRISSEKGDYVMLVDSNFASLKSDLVMSRDLSYKVEKDPIGLKAILTITYHHKGSAKDWRTDRYKDYARIYAPLGSRLISFDGATVPVSIGKEQGRSYFGSLFYVELNSSKTVTVSYYLPDYIKAAYEKGDYTLTWQRQSGNRINSAKVDVKLPSGVKSINPPTTAVKDEGRSISWSTDLTTDRKFNLNY